MILKLCPTGEVHVDETKIVAAWTVGRSSYIVKFGKDDVIHVDRSSFQKVALYLDTHRVDLPLRIFPEREDSSTKEPTENQLLDLCDQLRGVKGLADLSRLFGYEVSSSEAWTWHDVAVSIADRIENCEKTSDIKG